MEAAHKCGQVRKRFDNAWKNKDLWRGLYEECYEYALPQRNQYTSEGPGSKKMQRVFDSTAIDSTQRFANRIQSGLFPPQQKWCRLEPGPEIPPEKRDMTQQVLEVYNERLFAAIRQSNFDLAIGEFLLDMAVGTAVMLVQAGDVATPIRYTPVPQAMVAIEEGAFGQVDNVYRKLKIKAEAITTQWPDAVLDDVLTRLIEDKPSEDVDLRESTVFDYDTGTWWYYVCTEKGEDHLVSRKIKTSPWVVGRYMKVSGEVYGRGPLVTAIPDIKTLNKTKEFLLKNAAIAVAGVYTAADDGVLNPQTVRLVPAAIIPVARNGGPQGPSLAPLPRSGDFNVSQLVLNELQQSIKKIMLDDSLPPDTASARSATEIMQRMKELAQNLGSAFGRLITETMVPVVAKTLEIMDAKGMIDLPLKVNGMEVKVVPVSPIALAQAAEEVQSAVQWFQIASSMGPEGQAAIKVDTMLDFIGDKLGVPQGIRASKEEREARMQQMQQMAAAAAQAQAQPAPGEGQPTQ